MMVHAGVDYYMACPTQRAARWVSRAGLASYLFEFAHKPALYPYNYLATHTSEIPYVFRIRGGAPRTRAALYWHITPDEYPLSDAIVTAWRYFAAHGTPSASSAGPSAWPAYDERNETWMVFGGPGGIARAEARLKSGACALWDAAAS